MPDKQDVLKKVYNDPKINSPKQFYAVVKGGRHRDIPNGMEFTSKDIRTFINNQVGASVHRGKKVQYHIITTIAPHNKSGGLDNTLRDQSHQADLLDLGFEKQNGNHRYILMVIDVHSRYLWARACKKKTAAEVYSKIMSIYEEGSPIDVHRTSLKPRAPPINWESDNDGCFTSRRFKRWLKDNDIQSRYSPSDELMHNQIVERVNGTLRKRLGRLFTKTGNHKWVKPLQDVVDGYNESRHSTTKATPHDIYSGHAEPKKRVDTVKDNISIGDAVRIRNVLQGGNLGILKKSNLPMWSSQMYGVIRRVGHRYVLESEKMQTLKKHYLARDLLVAEYQPPTKGIRADQAAAREIEEKRLRRRLAKEGIDMEQPVLKPRRRTRASKRGRVPSKSSSKNLPQVTASAGGRALGRAGRKAPTRRLSKGDFVLTRSGNGEVYIARVLEADNLNKVSLQQYKDKAGVFKKTSHKPWVESWQRLTRVNAKSKGKGYAVGKSVERLRTV